MCQIFAGQDPIIIRMYKEVSGSMGRTSIRLEGLYGRYLTKSLSRRVLQRSASSRSYIER